MITKAASFRTILAFAGLLVAGYLLAVHFQGGRVACPTGGCEQVQSSAYSVIFGVPLPMFGVVSWLVLLVLAVLGGTAEKTAEAALSVAAAVFAVYLMAVQALVLHHLCVWCIGNDAATVVFAALALVSFRRSLGTQV